jgi:hypothetical protein
MTTVAVNNEEDLTIKQGSRFFLVINATVEWLTDLTGYVPRGMIRLSRTGPDTSLLADLTPFLTVDVPNSLVTIDLDADESSAWEWTHGAYDIEVYPPGDESKAVRILQGNVVLDKEVTHT